MPGKFWFVYKQEKFAYKQKKQLKVFIKVGSSFFKKIAIFVGD